MKRFFIWLLLLSMLAGQALACPSGSGMCEINAILSVGDTIEVGQYKQDGLSAEPIEWIILDVWSNQALVVSKYALISQPFAGQSADTDWASSEISIWLNGSFFDSAFDEREQRRIQYTNVQMGEETIRQKLFLLSVDECEAYLTDASRICFLGDITQSNAKRSLTSVDAGRHKQGVVWWLRTSIEDGIACIGADGKTKAVSANAENVYIRPAMWIVLDT